jgi:plasmid stabilization system protein ParE
MSDSIEALMEDAVMPRGSKSAYTDQQKREARHIEDSYRKRGTAEKRAERIAWATVNKQDGGGLKKDR